MTSGLYPCDPGSISGECVFAPASFESLVFRAFLAFGIRSVAQFLLRFSRFPFQSEKFFEFGPFPACNLFFSLSLVAFRAFDFFKIPYGTESLTAPLARLTAPSARLTAPLAILTAPLAKAYARFF